MAGYFKPKLEAKPKRRGGDGQSIYLLLFIFLDSLKLRTRILLGALVQILLCSALPMKWAVVPAVAMLLNSIITTIVQLVSPSRNSYLHGVVHGRSSAQIPSPDGLYGPHPGAKPVVVFNLGIQFNHPLGALAPGGSTISDYFTRMTNDLDSRRDELGLLSTSYWRAAERDSNSTLLISYHFRDVESIHRFAHEELHREAWHWYEVAKPYHIGIFHETFSVPAGNYETIYDHTRPVLLGKGSVTMEGKGGAGMKSSLLVNADTPALKTQYARLNRYESGEPKV